MSGNGRQRSSSCRLVDVVDSQCNIGRNLHPGGERGVKVAYVFAGKEEVLYKWICELGQL